MVQSFIVELNRLQLLRNESVLVETLSWCVCVLEQGTLNIHVYELFMRVFTLLSRFIAMSLCQRQNEWGKK